MSPTVATFIGSTSFCATLAFYIARRGVEIVPSLFDWVVNRNGFTKTDFTRTDSPKGAMHGGN